ncbi:MAG: HD domain-containing phosphohydrolase [Myxococcota bacterium]|nr:HD domain-containing phosphohydrolase [Myxococcota bacterium]
MASKEKSIKPTILCVDDEIAVLEGLQLNLRRAGTVHTATSGKEGLERISNSEKPFAIIISDMRMPEMNGAEFLQHARQISPNSVRILLTGQTEIESAISAVNDGGIFCYLQKPCPKEKLLEIIEESTKEFQLREEEREILEQTLWSSVSVMSEILGVVNEAAFGHAELMRVVVLHLAKSLALENVYEFELAAMLSQLGCMGMPSESIEKIHTPSQMTREEQEAYRQHPKIGQELLEKIPRLEDVALMIGNQFRKFPPVELDQPVYLENRRVLGAKMLRIAVDVSRWLASGKTLPEIQDRIDGRPQNYDTRLIEALRSLKLPKPKKVLQMLNVDEIGVGMELAAVVETITGTRVFLPGKIVTPLAIERLIRFHQGVGIKEPLRVLAPPPKASPKLIQT